MYNNREFIFVRAKSEYFILHKIFCDDIIAFEAKRNYVALHLTSGSLTTYISLSEIAEIFALDNRFLQLHRSFIISVKHIEILRRTQIVMVHGLNFMVGDIYKITFEEMVNYHLIKKSVVTHRSALSSLAYGAHLKSSDFTSSE